MNSPRVLILGQSFNNKYGGGITLTNLFKGWDRDKIAVAATGHVMCGTTAEICDTFYQLGNIEFKWRFPFNLIQKKFSSGLLSFTNKSNLSDTPDKTNIRSFLVDRLLYPTLEWSGLLHLTSGIILSEQFKTWLEDYRPEVLYLQVSTRDTILFAKDLYDYLKIPAVIHMMDDWPSTISRKGPFKNFWRKKIDHEFKQLLSRLDQFLSISDAMSHEYQARYNIKFIPFHNPIELNLWRPYSKKEFKLAGDYVKVLYSGRIGPGITDSLLEVADAIEKINSSGGNIKFHIQSPSSESSLLNKLQKYSCIIINPVVEYKKLPGILSGADILLISNDFDDKGVQFLRYSMPTKASEYMISGTPVLVYSHNITAVTKFFRYHRCGHCVTEQSQEKLITEIKILAENESLRRELSTNAVKVATQYFDADIVRNRFQTLLINLSKEG